jgi:ferric-dicitrate binding protein FerR (iron transport regulator)
METEHTPIFDLMIRLFEHTLDESGKKELMDWISLSAENRKYFYDEQEIWFSAHDQTSLSKYDKEKAFEAFQKRVSLATQSARRYRIRPWMKYVAGFILITICVLVAFFQGENKTRRQFADVVIEAPRGGLTKLNLPDGSLVWLNANSKIIYSQGFGIKDRTIRLVGEGYFEVKKNQELPFSILSGGLQIRDLGTRFNVRNYPADAEAEITLMEGKVEFNRRKDATNVYQLSPNQKAVIDKKMGKVALMSCDALVENQWTSGHLVFSGQPMQFLIRTLERNYNVTISVTNPNIMKCHFYGDFMRQDQSLNEILKALSSTKKFRYRIQGDHITLY